ncbi:MCP four helix bundle domain-containing protein [Clostridiaceae bacterium UIB06]|uniref:histidine kinase n=1 Tax=Clostridium thailandense TaxID=2794346 RepID=A0A949TXW1_9CLOT|nr:ATP-binding protein [Clostridium thailandense]MBV7274583.1 MCP four helix bundle domain-containing protein [Clostridium thailandense]MCH5138028.1 MCP four helix bundle domain-containing protein [Clostridiaceae bacterium UIB06]
MIKTLKGKISVVYICLVLMIAIVGFTSAFNLHALSRSIDGLMVNNYKSINAANNMIEAIDGQNVAILNYLNNNDQKQINLFYKNSDEFYKWYNIEANNITELGERDYVSKINNDYARYVMSFSDVQDIRNKQGTDKATNFYDDKITNLYNNLKSDLKGLAAINEKAMFGGKDKVTKDSIAIMYIILGLSSVAVIGGYLISTFFINKFLKPIYILTESIKSVREGELHKEIDVDSSDEIGLLAHEFNNMTKRLQQFEYSSKGKLLTEKNKSIAIVKSISDPLIVLDTNYKFTLLNDACEDIFGIKETDVLHKHFLEGIRNGELYEYISSIYKEDNEKKSEKIMNIEVNEKDYYFNIISTAIKDRDLESYGIVVLFQNITKLKQLEKIKTDFMGTISHELKTPLTSIMMGVSLITDKKIGDLNEKQKNIVDAIREDGERLASLISELLQLSKIESDKAIFNMKQCSIIGVIENCVKRFNDQAISKEVNLYYEGSEWLPQVTIDPEKVSWALNNLVSNALKYINAGDEISIKVKAKNNEMYVSVEDTGVGIPNEYQKIIFDKFVQVKGGDLEMRSSGIGLAITKEIIEAHGGDIWCESKLDVGSKFTFTLPISN